MKRGHRTQIAALQIGDRFYKLTDKKKEVWEKIEAQAKKTDYQTYSHFATKPGMLYPQPMRADTEVVFLRSADNVPATAT